MKTITFENCQVVPCEVLEVPAPGRTCFLTKGVKVGVPIRSMIERTNAAVGDLEDGGAYPLFLTASTQYELDGDVLTVKNGEDRFVFRCL